MNSVKAMLVFVLVLFISYMLYTTARHLLSPVSVAGTACQYTKPSSVHARVNKRLQEQARQKQQKSTGPRRHTPGPLIYTPPVYIPPSYLVEIARVVDAPPVPALVQPDPVVIEQPIDLSEEEKAVRDTDARLGWSTRQNVHDSGVIDSCKRIVSRALARSGDADSGQGPLTAFTRASDIISASAFPEQTKQRAREALQTITQMDYETRYDKKTEGEILAIVLDQATATQDQRDYFVTNLSDSVGVCGQGRASRLVDCLAFAQETPILPEAVIKRRLIDTLQDLQQKHSDPGVIKKHFADILTTESEQGYISQQQVEEYSQWPDSL